MAIKDYMVTKSEVVPTSIKVSKDILLPLKAKLKSKNQTIKAFFEASAKQYLSEDKAKKRQKAS